jgi:uncharacterized protein (TIGR02300 family)
MNFHPTFRKNEAVMVKAEWGTKRSCPKCATRFYDLTKEDPVSCISCGYAWMPESVLKSKQPMPFEQVVKVGKDAADTDADDDLDLDVDVDEDSDSPDNDVDLGGDDDLGVATGDDDVEIES